MEYLFCIDINRGIVKIEMSKKSHYFMSFSDTKILYSVCRLFELDDVGARINKSNNNKYNRRKSIIP